jgi:hypothetical protein
LPAISGGNFVVAVRHRVLGKVEFFVEAMGIEKPGLTGCKFL